jgi:tRNA/tmRNA/rRNA uracil-C5-methylase (TrmA/RlmC/RlmD family)
MTPTTCL